VLEFEKGMRGKVLVGGEILDLKNLAQQKLAERKKDRFYYKLGDDSRGKLVLGDVTLLFQFVEPPPAVAKLQLPAEARGAWWRNVDRGMMVSFLIVATLLGGSGGGLDVWWRQTGRYRAVQKTTKTSDLFQTLVEVKKQQAEEEKKDEDGKKDDGIAEGAEETERAAEPTDRIAEGMEPAEGLGSEEPGLGDQDMGMEDMAAGIDSSAMGEMIGDKFDMPKERAPSTATDRVATATGLVREKTVVSVMGSMYGEGVQVADTSGGRFGRGRDASAYGTIAIGSSDGVSSDYLGGGEGGGLEGEMAEMRDARLGGLGGPGGSGMIIPPPEVKAVKGPESAETIKGPSKKIERTTAKVQESKFKLELSGARGFSGKIDQNAVSGTLRQKQGAFNRCYIKAARANPDVGGRVTLKITIDGSGRASVAIVNNNTGSDELAACIKSAIESWGFPRPDEGRPVSFTIPLMFKRL
jgi:TonB family protein